MEITKTIKLRIQNYTNIFAETLEIYRSALSFIVDVVDNKWDDISSLSTKEQVNAVEKLIHKTSYNPSPKYGFDDAFYKYPSYLRRATIAEAIGIVSSYRANYQNWLDKKVKVEAKGKKFNDKTPTLQTKCFSFPVFYKTNMFQHLTDNQALIKVFYNNDWQWLTVTYDPKNLNNRNLDEYREQNPSLVKKGKKYFLHIPYVTNKKLNQTPVEEQTIVAVDLGLTNSAVCSAMRIDGTVTGRLFINQPVEKDRLYTKLNKIAKANRDSGIGRKPNLWRKVNGLSKQIVQDTVNQIVNFALEYNASVIVFEHLGKFKTQTRGATRLRQKLQFWCKQRIQHRTKHKAHTQGIRFSRVVAKNTSKLAFDGSGEVTRSKQGDMCTFSTGKQYHTDLSASYNIGSRYFIREILKTLSETTRLQLEAKVPSIASRTCCTLASLISLNKALSFTG